MSLGPLLPLERWAQFIPVLREGKLPIDYRTGNVTLKGSEGAHNPGIWLPYDRAQALAAQWGPAVGLGFVLTAADPFWCLDIDGAAQPDGTWSELSQRVCGMLPHTAVEVSQSGRGLHIWGRRSVMPAHASKNTALHLELYHEKRFILLGSNAVGDLGEECLALDAVIAGYFPPRVRGDAPDSGPRTDWRGPTDDAELLRRAMQSRSARAAFGGSASFADLWHADAAVLAKAYPANGDGESAWDGSSADAALAQHLAFWTGADHARIERLMRQSALARAKWEREDYMDRTIGNACAMARDVLQDKPVEAGPGVAPAAPGAPAGASEPAALQAVEGTTFLGLEAQQAMFAGCVYVLELHRVLIPGGKLVNPDRFKAYFGGYTFAMDARNERTSRNAWEAITESQLLRVPRVDGVCFRPQLPYGAIVTEGGVTRVNTWWPINVDRVKGDAGPFVRHVAKLYPDPHDQAIVLSFLAAVVQYPGVKFQWALLLQGVEGNAKTFISRAVSKAVGARYTAWPKASKIAAQFNSWLVGKIVYCVEDIFVDADSHIMEELKPMIAGGEAIEIEAKGVDQVSTEICGNFILNMNPKNGLRKSRNDRRLCVAYSAQQHVDDLKRDGITEEYVTGLYDWAHGGGWAVIAEFLHTFPIPAGLNPAVDCPRAPKTSSTDEAIEEGRGRVEQEILEAIDQGRPGFCGGWISSVMLDRLLREMRLDGRVPYARRADLLRTLDYVMHPALKGDRTNNPVLPDGGKPRLYVDMNNAASMALTSAAEVAAAYARAQLPK